MNVDMSLLYLCSKIGTEEVAMEEQAEEME